MAGCYRKDSICITFDCPLTTLPGVFFGHSHPTADSSRAVVCYWRKDVHLVSVNRLGSLRRNSVVRLTDRLDKAKIVDWDVKPKIKQTKQNPLVQIS